MVTRRTTLLIEADDLAQLQQEADRRGMSLAELLREIVALEAACLRKHQRPRFGIGRSGGGAAAASVEREDQPFEAHPFRS